MDRCELKRAVEKKISIWENELKQLALELWNHPETAWHEQYAVKTLCNFLNIFDSLKGQILYYYRFSWD